MRSPEERDRDRADLLAALDSYGAAMATVQLIAAANGVPTSNVVTGLPMYAQGYADLRWLEKRGELVSEYGVGGSITRWRRPGPGVVDRRLEEEDYRDVQRMYARWEEVTS